MKLATLAICIIGVVGILASAPLAVAFTKDYFIWDRDSNGNAAPAIQTALATAGYSGDKNSNLPGLGPLLEYRTVWICLGMYPDGDPLIFHQNEITILCDYLADYDSTCAYMEGGDAWYCDPWTSFHDYFHLKNWGHSGMFDLGSLAGQGGTFAEGMYFDYVGDDAIPDRLVIDSTSTSFYLFKNDGPEYGLMIGYDNGNSTYKTIASSCEFAGLADGADPSTKVALAESIMSFFEVPRTVVDYDLATIAIPSPTRYTPPNEVVVASCRIKNSGAQTASGFTAHMRISGGYEEVIFATPLEPGSTVTVDFPGWTAGAAGQEYDVTAWVDWSLDMRHGNDTTRKHITAWDDRWYIKSPWCYNGDSVFPDGYIGASEWADAAVRDVSDFFGRGPPFAQQAGNAYLYVMNDSLNLYLALDGIYDKTNTDLDEWWLYFEDSHDESWPPWPDSSEGLTQFINHAPPNVPWFMYKPLFSDSSSSGQWYWVSLYAHCDNITGHMQYEYIIPFGRDSARGDSIHPNLLAGLCDTVGFWTAASAEHPTAGEVYAWWPSSSWWPSFSLWHSSSILENILAAELGMIILNQGLEKYFELEVVEILSPPSSVILGDQYPVTVRVTNNGNFDESFTVYTMAGDSSNFAYWDSVFVDSLGPTVTVDVNTSPWQVAGNETTWTMCAWVAVADSDSTNNTVRKQVNVVRSPGIEELLGRGAPRAFFLGQNIPNPFAEKTTIRYAIPKKTSVTIRVFDITGSEVRSLVNDEVEPGFYTARWDSKNSRGDLVPNGVYFLNMYTGTFSMTRKMVLLR